MTIETELPAVTVRELPFEEHRRIHDIAAAAYEAATPVDYRYSALALRKAVDAAISALTLKDDPGNGGIKDAYLAGWDDCYSEPRPFGAARESLCKRYLDTLKDGSGGDGK